MDSIRRILKPTEINKTIYVTEEREDIVLGGKSDSPLNYFALNFYNELIKTEINKNIFFSPFSISTCFAMTYGGARGETADEIRDIFQFPNIDKTPEIFSKVIKDTKNRCNKSPNEINIANAIFTQKKYPVNPEYFEMIKKYYSGELFPVDFVKEGNLSVDLINKYVKEQTKGKIRRIIEEPVDPMLRMAILNAIYFYGKWEKQFNKKGTREGIFYTETGLEKDMYAFMHKKDDFLYTEGKGYQMLGMNHENRETMMVFVLPKIEYRMSNVEADLT